MNGVVTAISKSARKLVGQIITDRIGLTSGLFVGFLVLYLIPIWIVRFPPLTDYPNHLLRIFIMSNYSDPAYGFSDYFSFNTFPVPNLLADVVVLLLTFFVSIGVAGKVFLSLNVVLLPLSLRYFSSCLERPTRYYQWIGFLFIYSYCFNEGFMNFCIGIPVYFFVLGYWLRNRDSSSGGVRAVIGVLFILTYFAHIVAVIVLLWSVAVLAVTETRNPKILLRRLVPAFPVLVLIGGYLVYAAATMSKSTPVTDWFWTGFFDASINFFVRSFVSFTHWEVLLFVVPVLVIGWLLMRSAYLQLYSWRNKQLAENIELEPLRFQILILSLMVVYFSIPEYMGDFWCKLRLPPFILMLCPAAVLSTAVIVRFKKTVTALVLSTILYLPIHNGLWYRNFQPDFDDLMSGISEYEGPSCLLPIMIDTKGASLTTHPFWHAWAYYHIENGGAGPFIFALQQQLIQYTESMPRPARPAFFDPEEFQITDYVEYYEYILLWGEESIVSKKILTMYDPIHNRGKLRLYLRRG